MEIDLDEINNFFDNHQTTPMPQSVLRMIMSGTNLKSGDLETRVIEWRNLRDIFSPEIAQNIDASYPGQNIPVVRDYPTPTHHVYHPETGDYLGSFEVDP
jgi:hypothetical protein